MNDGMMGGSASVSQLYVDFRTSFNEALMYTALAALALSFLFSRSVVEPVLAVRFNQMVEKLNQVESMRRRLIGDVNHELRTSLTTIKGLMDGNSLQMMRCFDRSMWRQIASIGL